MSQLLDILHKHNALSDDVIQNVRTFIKEHHTYKPESDNVANGIRSPKKVENIEITWINVHKTESPLRHRKNQFISIFFK